MSNPELTGSKYSAFKKTMKAAKQKADAEELQSIKRTISNPLRSEGPKVITDATPGIQSTRGGRKRKTKRRKRKTKKRRRKKTKKRRRKKRTKRRK